MSVFRRLGRLLAAFFLAIVILTAIINAIPEIKQELLNRLPSPLDAVVIFVTALVMSFAGLVKLIDWLSNTVRDFQDREKQVSQNNVIGSTPEEAYLNGRIKAFLQKDRFIELSGVRITDINIRYDVYKSRYAFAEENENDGDSFESIQQAVETYEQFVLIGNPGAGKSTVLRKLASEAAEKRKVDRSLAWLPLWINLGIGGNPSDIDELIEQWRKTYGLQRKADTYLKNNELWLFLDGLNEIPRQQGQRQKVADALKLWLARYRNDPRVKVIVTCRLQDYDENLDLGLPIIKLRPMALEQVKKLLDENYDVQELVEEIQKPERNDLRRLVENPLNLIMLVKVYQQQKRVPTDLNTLYDQFTEALYLEYTIGRNEEGRTKIVSLSWPRLKRSLQRLAYRMILEGWGTTISRERAIRILGSQALGDGINIGLLVQEIGRNSIVVRFYHQELHGFFALPLLSKALGWRWYDYFGGLVADLLNKLRRPRFILLPNGVQAWKYRPHDRLSMLSDRLERRPFLLIEAITELEEAASPALPALARCVRGQHSEIKIVAAQAIAKIGIASTEVIEALCSGLKDNEPLVRKSMADTLQSLGKNAVSSIGCLIDSLEETTPVVLLSIIDAMDALGPLRNKAAIHIAQLVRDEDIQIRRTAIQVLQRVQTDKLPLADAQAVFNSLTDALLMGADEYVREKACQIVALMTGICEDAVDILDQLLGDDNPAIRYTALCALPLEKLIHTQYIEFALQDDDLSVRALAEILYSRIPKNNQQ